MFAFLAFAGIAFGAQADYTKDLAGLIADLKSDGAYVFEDKIDFETLETAYRPLFAKATSKEELLPVLERLVGELHDFHAFIGANNSASPRLVPSGTDIMAIWKGQRAFVEEVRLGSVAAKAEVRAGDEIVTIDGETVRQAAGKWLGSLPAGANGWEWALDSALAGRWNVPRKFGLRRGMVVREVELTTAEMGRSDSPLTVRSFPGGVTYLRPENSLGDDGLINELALTAPRLRKASGVILDLRNTQSGGNSGVARAILGMFISARRPYQRHVYEERTTGTVRDWVEYATPWQPPAIKVPLVVLVDRWTGSMGEGIAIGIDAMKRGKVVGIRMAGLRGAVDSTTLPVSGYRVFFPTERLFHVNGTPRHLWNPPVQVKPGPGDPWMDKARALLAAKA